MNTAPDGLRDAPVRKPAASLRLRAKFAIFAGIWCGYALLHWAIFQATGLGTGTWAAIPLLASAWLLGMRWGIVAGLMVVPINALLREFTYGNGLANLQYNLENLSIVIAMIVGAAIGRLRDLTDVVREEILRRVRIEEETRRLNEALEERVRTKTRSYIQAITELKHEVAERSRVEEMLRAREEQLRELFENANDIVYTHDLDGRRLSVNKAGLKLTGYTAEDVSRLSISELIAPEWLEFARSMIERKIDGDASTRYELEILAADGRRIPIEVSTRLVYDGGRPVAVQGIARDVSERRRAEQARLLDLRRLEAMDRVARAIEQTYPYARMIQQVLEVVREVFDADRAWLVHPLDPEAPAFRIPFAAARPEYDVPMLRGGEVPFPPELPGLFTRILQVAGPVARDGDDPVLNIDFLRDTQVRSQMSIVLRPKVGKPWLLGLHQCSGPRAWTEEEKRLFQDISYRITDGITNVLLHQDLVESEDKYRSLVENSVDGIFRVSREGRLLDVNPSMVAMLGYRDKEELLTKDPERELCFEAGDWWEILRDGAPREVRLRRRDGSEAWVESNARSLRDPRGRVVAYEGSLRDLSERRRAEEERRLLEAQVQQAQKMESLGILAGGIAHDFNNLLMGILGNSGIALMELPEDSPVRQCVAKIETAALRAADLTNQLLAYSGKGRFVVQPIDLSRLVEEMAHLLETAIPKKTTLTLDFPSDLPAIDADATQIRQVVMNLITNASDATAEEGGMVTVRTGVADLADGAVADANRDEPVPAGRYVLLEVADTGVGMDAETQRRMFDPFFTTKFTGRGLGLAAVLGIVRGHHGAIEVDSAPRRGTRVRIYFPASSRTQPPALPPDESVAGYRGHGTVLVVDDEPMIRDVARSLLAKFGFEVLTARDGAEGVERLRENQGRIVLVILDVTMPNMDGPETFREMRRISPTVPVLLSSGFSADEVAGQFQPGDIVGFIQKPYRPLELIERVRSIFADEARTR